jgi:hypothetical protein
MRNRSIPEIFSNSLSQFTTLLRKEGLLARAEISEKITQVAMAWLSSSAERSYRSPRW